MFTNSNLLQNYQETIRSVRLIPKLTLMVATIACVIAGILIITAPLQAAEKKDPYLYEDDDIRFRVIRRAPKQIAAFYEGRGFPSKAIAKIIPSCSSNFPLSASRL